MTIELSIPNELLIEKSLPDYHTIFLHEDFAYVYAYIFIGDTTRKSDETVIKVTDLFYRRFKNPSSKKNCEVHLPKYLKPGACVNILPLGYDPVFPIELNIQEDYLLSCRVVLRGKGSGKVNLPLEYEGLTVQLLFFEKGTWNIEEILTCTVEGQNDKHSQIKLHRSYVGKDCFLLKEDL